VPAVADLVAQLEPALGRRSAYLDLADGLRMLILDGRLVVGDRLPPQRTLADALKLSRTTVVSSLTLLRAEGFLSTRQGSATTVCAPPERVDRPDEPAWLDRDDPAVIDLSIAVLPAASQVVLAAHRAAERLPAMAAGPGLHPLGIPELRSAVAARLSRRGLPTRAEQIVITQGALHGWDLILRTFARPGSPILIEQPSYPAAIDAIRVHHALPQPVAVTAGGWQWPRRLERPADIAYVVPDFQNPTGHLADDSERRQLVKRTRGMLLCVDETFVELGDKAAVSTPTAAFGRQVLTIGTLSKLVWAGLRIGWVRGPREVVNRLAAARSSQDVAAPVLDQLLALELMDHLDEIGDSRRALLRERRVHATVESRRTGWDLVEPSGGMFLWVDLNGASSTQLSHAVRPHGVRIPPGTRFSTSGTHDRYFRLPFTCPRPALSEAIRRIVEVAGETGGKSRSPSSAVWTI
jgi:DNA-binding transcriptional MocR family regulator